MKKFLLGCLLFIAVERFCYYQTGTFSLHKMVYDASPPSPTSTTSPIKLQMPLKFIGAGKQFYAFETADGAYVVKFMKWSRRKPLPLSHPLLDKKQAARARLAANLQKSCQLALTHLPDESQLVTPEEVHTFTLIDKLGITHTVPASHTHFYVQRKAVSFTHHLDQNPALAKPLLQSFIQTVKAQCTRGIANLDPITDRNYGVVEGRVILLDVGSLLQSPKLHHTAAIQHEIVLELLPLRQWLQQKHPEHLATFDTLLREELK